MEIFDDKNNKNFMELDVLEYLLKCNNTNNEEYDYELFIFRNINNIYKSYFDIENSFLFLFDCKKYRCNDIIEYCRNRVSKDINPILKSVYYMFLIFFEEKIMCNKKNQDIYIKYVESIHTIVYYNYIEKDNIHDLFNKLFFALIICLSRNIEKDDIIKDIISVSKHNITSHKLYWHKIYDLLLYNKKINLSKEEKNNLVFEYENEIKKYMRNNFNTDYHLQLYYSIKNIAKYYFYDQKDKSKNIIEDYFCFIKEIIKYNDVIFKNYALSKVLELSKYFQFNEISDKVMYEQQNINNNNNNNNIECDFGEDTDIECDFGEDTDKYLDFIVNYKIVDINVAKDCAINMINGVLGALVSDIYIFDKNLRRIASVKIPNCNINGYSDNDISELRDYLFAKLYSFDNINYIKYIDKIMKKLKEKDLIDYIKKSRYIYEEQFGFIELAIKRYFEKDYISFVHLIIPQIEAILRNILELDGELIYKYDKENHGFNLLTLGTILNTEHLKDILGNDFLYYLKMFLVDSRALNFRNNICHGLYNFNEFNDWYIEASRCIEILLKLSKL